MTDPQVAETYAQLNQWFYGSEPTAYFRDRLTMLGMRAAKSSELAELLSAGVEWGQLRLRRDEDDQPSDDEAQARTDRFVIAESQVLLHHVSETLIRMFLAHAGTPECPWMELSALRLPREFRQQVEQLASPMWSQTREDDVAKVFMKGIPMNPDEAWHKSRQTCVRLLRILARRLKEDSALYNSAKHGMTVIPGHGSMGLFTEEGEPVIGSNGAQIVYLLREKVPEKREVRWSEKTQWLNPEEAAWLTQLAIAQLEGLWAVARWRYLGESLDRLNLVSDEAIDALGKFPRPGDVLNFRRDLFTELL